MADVVRKCEYACFRNPTVVVGEKRAWWPHSREGAADSSPNTWLVVALQKRNAVASFLTSDAVVSPTRRHRVHSSQHRVRRTHPETMVGALLKIKLATDIHRMSP